jgi:hypothetical protein
MSSIGGLGRFFYNPAILGQAVQAVYKKRLNPPNAGNPIYLSYGEKKVLMQWPFLMDTFEIT